MGVSVAGKNHVSLLASFADSLRKDFRNNCVDMEMDKTIHNLRDSGALTNTTTKQRIIILQLTLH